MASDLEGDGRSRRRTKQRTRQAILETARDMVIERGSGERISMRLSTVLAKMGLTSGAAYNIWSNQDAFQRELALEVASNVEWASLSTVPLELDLQADEPLDELRRLADQYFAAFTDAEGFFLALRFWGVREPSPPMRDAILAGYRTNTVEWQEFFGLGLAWAGRRVKPEFTMQEVAVAVTAVIEGCSLRHRFEPDALLTGSGRTVHGELLVATLFHFTEPVVAAGPEA